MKTSELRLSILTDEELMNLLPGAVRLPIGWIDTARAIEAAVIKKLSEQSDPVAIVGDVYQLLWLGSSPIAAITSKHGIQVGDKLYTHPIPKSEWQPIDAAPKDGTRFFAVDQDGGMGVVWWNTKERMFEDIQCLIEDDGMLTHWQPLPQPPEMK